MDTIIANANFLSLINEIPEGIHVYYNKRYRRFEYHYSGTIQSPNLIKTPCAYEMKGYFMEFFKKHLNDQQRDIAESYPFKRGYFDYLREMGLYDFYEESKMQAKANALTLWFIKHNIPLVTKDIDIDCRYL